MHGNLDLNVKLGEFGMYIFEGGRGKTGKLPIPNARNICIVYTKERYFTMLFISGLFWAWYFQLLEVINVLLFSVIYVSINDLDTG